MTIDIQAINTEINEGLEQEIREKIMRYFKRNRLLRHIEVFLHKKKKKGQSIGIACHLMRETLFINVWEENIENALYKAIHRLKKQLEKY